MEAIHFGKYVVSDPEVCHGRLTFKGTRIFVESVLDMVSEGKDWDYISDQYYGKINREAIAEAIQVTKTFFVSNFRQVDSIAA